VELKAGRVPGEKDSTFFDTERAIMMEQCLGLAWLSHSWINGGFSKNGGSPKWYEFWMIWETILGNLQNLQIGGPFENAGYPRWLF